MGGGCALPNLVIGGLERKGSVALHPCVTSRDPNMIVAVSHAFLFLGPTTSCASSTRKTMSDDVTRGINRSFNTLS